jgi:hypothetical protein
MVHATTDYLFDISLALCSMACLGAGVSGADRALLWLVSATGSCWKRCRRSRAGLREGHGHAGREGRGRSKWWKSPSDHLGCDILASLTTFGRRHGCPRSVIDSMLYCLTVYLYELYRNLFTGSGPAFTRKSHLHLVLSLATRWIYNQVTSLSDNHHLQSPPARPPDRVISSVPARPTLSARRPV